MFKLLISLLTLTVANQLLAGVLSITSTPGEADIYLGPIHGNVTLNKAGATSADGKKPFVIDMKDVIANYSQSEVFAIEIRKKGFESKNYIIPKLDKADLTIEVNLTRISKFEKAKEIDQIIAELFDAQRLIRGKNYSDAQQKLLEVEKITGDLSVNKELLGSAYYLQGDYKKALAYFQMAYMTNPDNLDAYKMIVYLEKSMGVTKAKDAEK